MAALLEARHHVHAHLAQSDESQFHGDPLFVALPTGWLA
jgi:hypothetical protein